MKWQASVSALVAAARTKEPLRATARQPSPQAKGSSHMPQSWVHTPADPPQV